MSIKYFSPPMRIRNEDDFIESIARHYREKGCKVYKQVKVNFGYVDLAIVTTKNNLLLLEFKMSSGFHDVAYAFGQLLLYREQIDKSKFTDVVCIIYLNDSLPRSELDFLEKVCAKYGVEVIAPQPCKDEEE